MTKTARTTRTSRPKAKTTRAQAQAKTDDRFDTITESFIKAIESGAADPHGWRMPWNRLGTHAPRNIASRNRYQGMNHLLLAAAAMDAGAPALFGTVKQWNERGMRRLTVEEAGHGHMVIRMVPIIKTDKVTGEPVINPKTGQPETFSIVKVFVVHGIWQVVDAEGHEGAKAKTLDRFGYNADGSPKVADNGPAADERAEAFFAALGAYEVDGGDRAYYSPVFDHIGMPARERFESTIAYYTTRAHEHTHWTGHASRLGRPGIVEFDHFGSERYAFEELVAELGAAFVGNLLGFETTGRPDHANYLANWLRILRNDSKALMRAASQAEAAAMWMVNAAGADLGDSAIAADETDETTDAVALAA